MYKSGFISLFTLFLLDGAAASGYGSVTTPGVYYTQAGSGDFAMGSVSNKNATSEWAYNDQFGTHIYTSSYGTFSQGTVGALGELQWPTPHQWQMNGFLAIVTAEYYMSVFAPTQIASIHIDANPFFNVNSPYGYASASMTVAQLNGSTNPNIFSYECFSNQSVCSSPELDTNVDTQFLYKVTVSARVFVYPVGGNENWTQSDMQAELYPIFAPWMPIPSLSDSLASRLITEDMAPATAFSFSPGWNNIGPVPEPSSTFMLLAGGILIACTLPKRPFKRSERP